MAQFFRTLAATMFFMLVVEICCWPCPPKMRRDMDGKRGAYPTRYRCSCGTVLYDPGSELCCDNNRYPKRRGHLCCGNRTYNRFSQVCCRGGKVDWGCCGKKPRGKCCAGMPYYPSTEACCDGQLSSLVGITSPACCGKEVYDSNQKICCQGHTLSKPRNGQCCGAKAYNPTRQKCCRYGFFTMVITSLRGRCPITDAKQ